MKPVTAGDPDEVEFVDDDTLREHTQLIMKIVHKERRVKAKAKKSKRRQSKVSRRKNTH